MTSKFYKKYRKTGWGILAFLFFTLFCFLPEKYGSKGFLSDGQVAIAQDNEQSGANEEKKDGEGQAGAGDEEAADAGPDVKAELAGLEEKRKDIQDREEQLRLEEERIAKYKKEVEEKIEKLASLQRQIDESLEKLNRKETENERLKREAEEAKMAQLVKVFSSMKPKKAGEIVNNMDLDVAKKLFLKMKGDRAGQILSYVNSEQAAKISEKLTEKKSMFE